MAKTKARFIEPMLLLRTEQLPEGSDWIQETKLDGYRALAFKSRGEVHLRSRKDNDFLVRYPNIAKALAATADGTVIDGDVVPLDEEGKPSFNLLQNYGSAAAPLHFFYVFDLLVLSGKDVTHEPLVKRRELLHQQVLRNLSEPIRHSPIVEASLDDLIASVKAQAAWRFPFFAKDFGGFLTKPNTRTQPSQPTVWWNRQGWPGEAYIAEIVLGGLPEYLRYVCRIRTELAGRSGCDVAV